MQLIDVLRHDGRPRTTYFVEIPSSYGNLRLDLSGDVGVALAQNGVSAEDAVVISGLMDKALSQPDGIKEQALLDITRWHPFATNVYSALADYYTDQGDRLEAIYFVRQAIALQPTYVLMTLLGRLLGQAGMYEEALILQSYLWGERRSVPQALAYNVIRDYLITLGKSGDWQAALHTAAQAISEMGNDTMLIYQFIYAHIQTREYAEARALLDKALPLLEPSDPLYTHFFDLSNSLDELMAEIRKGGNK